MSMPRTCAGAHRPSAAKADATRTPQAERMPHLIPRILMPVNHVHVKNYCLLSLARICQEYNVPPEHSTVSNIREGIQADGFSYIKSLALFFLLLNVDSEMKRAIIDSETPLQQGKCVNFFMNLRRHAVPHFMSHEGTDVIGFTTRCQDMWSVA
jgi:hypothetical protein